MADNFLEKQYADYQTRKTAIKSGTQRKAHQALWQVAEIEIPSADDARMQQFYVEAFCGEAHERGVQFDNGLCLHFVPYTGTTHTLTIRIASRYQHEQLLYRLTAMGITSHNGTIIDTTGNRITIIL